MPINTASIQQTVSQPEHIALATDVIVLRYQEKVDKQRYTLAAHLPLDLQSRRILKFFKKEYNLINLALAFLKREADERYLSRKIASQQALKQATLEIEEWSMRFTLALKQIEYSAPALTRVRLHVVTLSPHGLRVANLAQKIDAIFEQMLTLEYRKIISTADREMIGESLMNHLVLIKRAAMGTPPAT
jgi:hypothetical protein